MNLVVKTNSRNVCRNSRRGIALFEAIGDKKSDMIYGCRPSFRKVIRLPEGHKRREGISVYELGVSGKTGCQ